MHRFSFLLRYFPLALFSACFLHEESGNWRCNHRTKQECWWIMVLLLHMLEKDGKWWPPSNPKKTFAYVPLVSLLYFSCFSSALIQSSFFNVIYVKLLPFGKIRSLAGAPHASGCCKHRTPKPALISKVSLKITSGGKVFKGHTKKTWLERERRKKSGVKTIGDKYVIQSLPPTRRCTK